MWPARLKLGCKGAVVLVKSPAPVPWPALQCALRRRSAVTEAAQALPSPEHRGRVLSFSEIPSPKGLPVLGTMLSLLAAGSYPRLHEYVDTRHKTLGSVYREAIGPADAVFVADPLEMQRVFRSEGRAPRHLLPEPWVLYNELFGCKRGLFFMDGEEWIHYRRIMNKFLLKATPRGSDAKDFLTDPCNAVSNNLLDRWHHIRVNGEILDMESELYRWSINTVVSTLLGGRLYASLSLGRANKTERGEALESAVSEISSVVHLVFKESARLTLIPARFAYTMHLPAWNRFVHAVDAAISRASALVNELIQWCKEQNMEQNDEKGLLIQMLSEGIETKYIIRIVTDLLLAAGDTVQLLEELTHFLIKKTAYSTQWAIYLLAKHPEMQEKIFNEIREAGLYQNKNYKGSEALVQQLTMLKGVIRESLRLYPVAPFLTRILPEDCPIGGYNVPAGNLVLLSIYTSGRDSRYFPDPQKFWPERWMRKDITKFDICSKGERQPDNMCSFKANEQSRGPTQKPYVGVTNPYASLPFGLGVRSCIGRRIAEMQMSMTIAKLVNHFHMDLLNKDDVRMILRLVSVPATPIRVRFRER